MRKGLFENQIEDIKSNKKILDVNKRVFLEYIRAKQSEGLTYNRLNRICSALKYILKEAKFDVRKIDNDKARRLAVSINSHPKWKDWTKNSNLKALKTFLKWLNKNYKTQIDLEEIKPVKPKNSLMPEYLITPEEYQKILENTASNQVKLIIELLYETGARISEILDLKIQNVSFNDYGAKILVHGKTGQRPVYSIWYANDLKKFIQAHPNKDKPDSPLFYTLKDGETRPFDSFNFRKILNRASKKAGITKKVYPHLFRHTRLTEWAKELPEQSLKALAGWSGASKMAQTYVHLSQSAIEGELLQKVYGMKANEEKSKPRTIICPRCKEPNEPHSVYCSRCGFPLNSNLIELEDKLEKIGLKSAIDSKIIETLIEKILNKKLNEKKRKT